MLKQLAPLFYVLPFMILNAIVAMRVEPLFSWIRSGPFEYVLLFGSLLLMAWGSYVASRSLFKEGKLQVLSAAVSLALLIAFLVIGIALGTEVYECDILGIPNCD